LTALRLFVGRAVGKDSVMRGTRTSGSLERVLKVGDATKRGPVLIAGLSKEKKVVE